MNSFTNVYGFDTETDNDGTKAWVCQWALSDGQTETHGRNLEDFKREVLYKFANVKGKTYIYIWNLKYDLEFIKYAIYDFCNDWDFKLSITMRKGNPISIKLEAPEDRRIKSQIIFRDGAKKMQGSLRSIAPIFGMQKLEGPDFVPGWSAALAYDNPDTWTYVHMDARIVAVAMRYFHKNGFSASTSSGDAWRTAKQMMKADDEGHEIPQRRDLWEKYFPTLSYELDHDLRDGYTGGLNISENIGFNYAEGHGGIEHVDITSMYPTCLYWDDLPIGLPTFTEEPPAEGLLWVGKLRLRFKLKDNRVAWFQFKNGADCIIEGLEFGKPVYECKEFHNLTLTSVDFITLQQDYDVEEDPEDYGRYFYVFKSSNGLFRRYIDRFIKQKNESAKGSPERAQAKIMLNALYGRFALIPDGEETTLQEDPETGDLRFVSEAIINENMDSYLPYAMFTTAWARVRLLDIIRRLCNAYGKDCIIHSDTDSVIHYGPRLLDGTLEYDSGLGTWATECNPEAVLEGGFKRYIEILHYPIRSEKDLSLAAAGVPQHTNHLGVPIGMWVELLDEPGLITTEAELGHEHYTIKSEWLRNRYIENGMNPDDVNTLKLLPSKVPGGVILEGHTHRLSDNMIMRLRR